MEFNHEHCQLCVSISCSAIEECCLVFCPFKCGAKLHKCKLMDHETICPQVHVECLNVHYGCPYKMVRRSLGLHLKYCPASVVLCNMRWTREIAVTNCDARDMSQSLRIDQLDVAMALKDQMTLNETKISEIRCVEDDSCKKPSNGYKMEISQELNQHRNEVLILSLESRASTISEITANSKKHLFLCSELMQRQEFSYHYLNYHIEIQGGCSTWLEHRCPLSFYGCSFSQHRFEPLKGFLSFNSYFNHLGVGFLSKEQNLSQDTFYLPISGVYEYPTTLTVNDNSSQLESLDNKREFSLLDIPDLAFENLLKYLDSFSLKNLSSVSLYLRYRCEQFLQSRGIVIAKWSKMLYNKIWRWQIEEFKWAYSNCPSKIQRWQFKENKCLSNHLQKCPFNVKASHTNPELIPAPIFLGLDNA